MRLWCAVGIGLEMACENWTQPQFCKMSKLPYRGESESVMIKTE